MKIKEADWDDVNHFVKIYNSAIILFPQNQRADATPAVFKGMLKRENCFLLYDEEDQDPKAFGSYQITADSVAELGSLYVMSHCQKNGYGKTLLNFIQQKLPRGTLLYAKVLCNAPWSISFYSKNGFTRATESDCAKLQTTQNSWELVYFKTL